ncbi:MAG: DUF4276 family protein [Candidatus Sumerlaeota bacterium]|nr:DUF4276 family protein [Candidatus Sumerlaeota bacterium]
MIRVYVVVEGDTESDFLKEVVEPYLVSCGVYVFPCIIGVPGHKGGDVRYSRAQRNILNLLQQERETYCSTFFDYYGLGHDFPGFAHAQSGIGIEKARTIEKAMRDDIKARLDSSFDAVRFIPYIQMHEFEALLFSDPEALARGLYRPQLSQEFAKIRRQFSSPEDINDNEATSPSKRIKELVAGYDKVAGGSLASISIGLDKIRKECAHFAEWIMKLETLKDLS